MGSVDRVAQYGLKDGKVFDYVKNETPSHTKDEGMLKALFRNLGVKQLGWINRPSSRTRAARSGTSPETAALAARPA